MSTKAVYLFQVLALRIRLTQLHRLASNGGVAGEIGAPLRVEGLLQGSGEGAGVEALQVVSYVTSGKRRGRKI